MRFVPEQVYTGPDAFGHAAQSLHIAQMQALQSASWRTEDKEREYRKDGNEVADVLTPADIMQMGRWHAFVQIQRAGAVRQDIAFMQHDFS